MRGGPRINPGVVLCDLYTARVATVGLNPSRLEFLSPTGQLWSGSTRRLETRLSLGVRDRAQLTREHGERVVDNCLMYFQRNPYMEWFGQLEILLNRAVGASYLDGSACHLDVVQWATDPTWSRLPAAARRQLVASDLPFLQTQLRSASFRLVLANGAGVLGHIGRLGARLEPVQMASDGTASVRIEAGRLFDAIVAGWSSNLQSGHGVTNALRADIAMRVAYSCSPTHTGAGTVGVDEVTCDRQGNSSGEQVRPRKPARLLVSRDQ